MDNLNKRIGVISKIITLKPGLGKTAMMKYIFLLQMVYKLPLDYDFEIYTYGPYSSDVMEDIDWAKQCDIISMETTVYPSGHSGYSLRPSLNIQRILDEENELIHNHVQDIEKVIKIFGDKTAKELELLTTIIYLHQNFIKNNWECNMAEVSQNVHEIKPHFDIKEIQKEYLKLEELGFLPKTTYQSV